MTDNVVTFRGNPPPDEPEEYVFVCGECRSRTFQLLAGGDIVCSACDTKMCVCEPDGDDYEKWRKLVPPLPKDTSKIAEWDSSAVDVHIYADESMARRRVFKTITQWEKDGRMMFVNAYSNPHGEGYAWMDLKTEEEREWLLERLDRLREWVSERDLGSTHELKFVPTDDDDADNKDG